MSHHVHLFVMDAGDRPSLRGRPILTRAILHHGYLRLWWPEQERKPMTNLYDDDDDLGPLSSDIARASEIRLMKENRNLRAEVKRLTEENLRLVGDLVRAVDRSSFNMLTAALAGAYTVGRSSEKEEETDGQ